jgi:hypothetical protein
LGLLTGERARDVRFAFVEQLGGCTAGFADTDALATELNLCSSPENVERMQKWTSAARAKSFAERAKHASTIAAGVIAGCTRLESAPFEGHERTYYDAMKSAAIECLVVDAGVTAAGIAAATAGGCVTAVSLGGAAPAGVPVMAVGTGLAIALGRAAVEVEKNKWRSIDGVWQYRAKPDDLAERHVHIEKLEPETGKVLRNEHLWW